MQWAKKQTGFTIVELLIVVVVIAILAAITIVAYNGIQERARSSSAQSAASQAARKIALYAVDHNDQYPASLEEAGVANDGSLQYTGGGSTYCVTATAQNVSYFQNNTSSVAVGACPGHGVNGAVAITNFVTNPSFETAVSGWSMNTPGLANGATGTTSNPTSGNQGSRSLRFTLNTPGSLNGFGPYTAVNGLNASDQYKMSAWIRSNKPVQYRIVAERRDAGGTLIATLFGTLVTLTPDTWTRLTLDVPATANMARITFAIYGVYSSIAANDWVEWDGFMLHQGASSSSYADGSTTNPAWVWTGTPHASTSIGSPV